ncbi:formate/nitrite transporter family protein [Paenibacillus sp. JX-17]|uniref:Formate/nitrite transporter family protein n=1 Tax=Paenibacillus lacisoli TaxID=3064525 RepID=A0ABT9CFV0_9BACL|nr:formate/nitrite transporter family protein [Paenibacillus sp. JX-17]MDO7907765.1 formate/nitrite transporter family protein [Paenibacillus sp. JX-17]
MDYVKPAEVLENMIASGQSKAELSHSQLIVRGALAGAILACATTLAYTAAAQTHVPLAGAIIFPVGFIMIILLGLELVTGSFALIPLALLERRATTARMIHNFVWVILGHLLGCGVYAALYGLTLTKMGTDMSSPLIQTIISASETKTNAYRQLGAAGMGLVIIKAVLCNWLVTLGVVMAMTSKSTLGKIAAMSLPVITFFAQGFEHAVVNMFVIPAGILLGASVTWGDWWLWNQVPVLIGNFIGGALFTGILFYVSQRGFARKGRTAEAGGLHVRELNLEVVPEEQR